MKVLLINGSPNEHGCTYTALSEVADTLHKHNFDTEILYLGKKPIAGCISCMKCEETGKCIFNDKVNEVLADLDNIDAIIVGSPVYYAGAAGQLTSFLDRLFFCSEAKMAGKLGASVVSCRRGGAIILLCLNLHLEQKITRISVNTRLLIRGNEATDKNIFKFLDIAFKEDVISNLKL